jgi:recombination protein RecR
MNFNSPIIEKAIESLSSFPGVGRKTAMRMVIHLINSREEVAYGMSNAISRLKEEIRFCSQCGNVSEDDLCGICSNTSRDESVWCIVSDFKDVMAIENTAQYKGLYHVLGGLISPVDGVGPNELSINRLLERIKENKPSEIIIALSATMEGDTTAFYISKLLKEFEISVSTISRGISVGGELDYADELTLARSISNRTPYNN